MTVSADHFHTRTWGKHRCRTARRITKDYAGGSTNDEDFYFNENYQVVEVRKNSDTDAAQRFLWDVIYIDAPAVVEIDTNTDGTRDFRLWPTFDGNFNVTSLVTDQGKVVERYAYTPYGERIILNGSRNYADSGADADGSAFTVDTNGSDYSYGGSGFQGLWFDAETGQWYQRARYNSPVLGFTQRDKIGYADSMNLQQPYRGNPVNGRDPSGRMTMTETWNANCRATIDAAKAAGASDQAIRHLQIQCQIQSTDAELWFNVWYAGEKAAGLGWMTGLPDCPCKLNKDAEGGFVNPDDSVWENPSSRKYGYHVNASVCMRSATYLTNGAGQQCCYDSCGSLITGGHSAGTPDRISPGYDSIDFLQRLYADGDSHQEHDVIPWDAAERLDKNAKTGKSQFRDKYLEVRPPNPGKNCQSNTVN